MQIHRLPGDIAVLADQLTIPGIGTLPVNAFVIGQRDAMVIDTGLSLSGTGFLEALSSVVDPADIGSLFLTHPDRDHTGALFELLAAAPGARLITTFLSVGILSCEYEVPLDRVHLVSPGVEVEQAGHRLTVLRPPLFDSPATVGVFDHSTGTLFSSDCFGAPLETEDAASCADVGEFRAADVREGQLLWVSVDAPWAQVADPVRFRTGVDALRGLEPDTVLSSHLPPIVDPVSIEGAFEMAMAAPGTEPFVGPDQAALEAMLASFEPVAP